MPFKTAFALCRHHTPCHSLLGLGFGSMSHDEQSPFTPHAAAVIAAALTRIGLRSPDALLISLLDIAGRGHSRSHTRPCTSPHSRTLHTHATHTLPQRSLLIVRSLPRSARSMHRCSPPDHPIFDAASKAAPSDAADVTRLLTAIVRVHICAVLFHFTRIQLHACLTRFVTSHDCLQVRHREAAHVVKKTKVSLLPLLPHANENQLGQLAQV